MKPTKKEKVATNVTSTTAYASFAKFPEHWIYSTCRILLVYPENETPLKDILVNNTNLLSLTRPNCFLEQNLSSMSIISQPTATSEATQCTVIEISLMT